MSDLLTPDHPIYDALYEYAAAFCRGDATQPLVRLEEALKAHVSAAVQQEREKNVKIVEKYRDFYAADGFPITAKRMGEVAEEIRSPRAPEREEKP